MTVTQAFVGPDTPMGATLRAEGGATFRVWAPRALDVRLVGAFADGPAWDPLGENRLVRDADGYWAGYKATAREGDPYKFWIEGAGSRGYKRDPYARELSTSPPYPASNCIIRGRETYRWRATGWRPPDFADLVLYQLHVGTFHGEERPTRVAGFLDVALQLDYLADLGVNGIQLLPVVEFASPRSLGYDGSDIFSPEMDYTFEGAVAEGYLAPLNAGLDRLGAAPLTPAEILVPADQLKILVDLAHLRGLAVLLDVVYNHAGFQIGGQDESLWFFDRAAGTDPNDSLYFTDRTHTGPVFAFWKGEVRQFLIDNAVFFLDEYRVDGLRYDQASVIDVENRGSGWAFLQAVTGTANAGRPETIQIAEYWPKNPFVTVPSAFGGGGFHATWNDGLREALRGAIAQAAQGAAAFVDLDGVARELVNPGFADLWRAVNYVESHDEVYRGREPRIARLADRFDARSWYARSRSRVALCLLLAAPGIPMVFMGQEILEDKEWSDDPAFFQAGLVFWEGLRAGDRAMVDMHRCCREMVGTRRALRALRRGGCNVFHVNGAARVLAVHRWIEGTGEDVVVVASLQETHQFGYELGLPGGRWREIFNSDVYDHWVNPQVVGNGGEVFAATPGLHGFSHRATLTLPANSVLVLARVG